MTRSVAAPGDTNPSAATDVRRIETEGQTNGPVGTQDRGLPGLQVWVLSLPLYNIWPLA